MNQRDIILVAMAKLPDLDDSPPTRWPGPPDTDCQLPPCRHLVSALHHNTIIHNAVSSPPFRDSLS